MINENRIFFLLFVLLGSALLTVAAAPQTAITVSIKNAHDRPLDNAAVIIDFLGSHQVTKLGKRSQVHWEVHTNQAGVAHFPPVPQGTLQIQVIAKDYQTFGKKFDVDTDEKAIDITLSRPQQQYSAHPPLKPAGTPKQ